MPPEALNLDQAVEKFMAPQESAQEADQELDSAAEDLVQDDPEEQTEEVDSEVDDLGEDDVYDGYDTDEESAEADDEPDYEEPETITVKVDGEEVAVTLEDLKRSYSGQGKIQKGMQEAAEARKAAEQAFQQSAAMAQQLTAMYQQVQREGFVRPPQEPDRAMMGPDPIGYMEAKAKYEDDLKAFNNQQQQMAQMRQMQQAQNQQMQQQKLAQEMEILKEKVPEFGDAEKATKLRDSLVRTGGDYGYSQDELAGITDHRALMVLRDAMRWRQSQAKRSQVEQKAKGARPVIKPQAKKTQDPKRKQAQQSRSKLKKSGSIDDALGLIMNV